MSTIQLASDARGHQHARFRGSGRPLQSYGDDVDHIGDVEHAGRKRGWIQIPVTRNVTLAALPTDGSCQRPVICVYGELNGTQGGELSWLSCFA